MSDSVGAQPRATGQRRVVPTQDPSSDMRPNLPVSVKAPFLDLRSGTVGRSSAARCREVDMTCRLASGEVLMKALLSISLQEECGVGATKSEGVGKDVVQLCFAEGVRGVV